MKHIAFLAESLLVTTDWQLPTELPSVAFCWPRPITTLQGRDAVCIYRLDYPVDCDGYQLVPLRQTHGRLSQDEYLLAGKAAELLYWDSNSKFCGCCGGPMRWQTEISKQCPYCGKELWPSPATAVIVRVTRGDEMLMIQSHKFKGDMYGHVAGFVETGETLEQCVARELMEETKIRVKNLRYFGSQPWPYPYGLMVAFTADYESGELEIQRKELRKAGWFRRDHLPTIPDEASISRWLIDDWLKERRT
ncbi:MAG: NAD(+) diphosphatase [Bacteroidaceae bacterium]|nr:NAD(+) diphosphatase [Bacteroidaceae bacterium]MDE6159675.1 NAD(+) diphosphatase [Bacteroidaceae bacterium]